MQDVTAFSTQASLQTLRKQVNFRSSSSVEQLNSNSSTSLFNTNKKLSSRNLNLSGHVPFSLAAYSNSEDLSFSIASLFRRKKQ